MTKYMYVCIETNDFHPREIYGWSTDDKRAFREFKKFLEQRKAIYQRSSWKLYRINYPDSTTETYITTELDSKLEKIGGIFVDKYLK